VGTTFGGTTSGGRHGGPWCYGVYVFEFAVFAMILSCEVFNECVNRSFIAWLSAEQSMASGDRANSVPWRMAVAAVSWHEYARCLRFL